MSTPKTDIATDTRAKIRHRTKEPPMYRVLLHNDDFTTMEFVIEILVVVFKRTLADATRIMLNVHRKGTGVCGTYPFEIAETKVETVEALARTSGFPLRCSLEKV